MTKRELRAVRRPRRIVVVEPVVCEAPEPRPVDGDDVDVAAGFGPIVTVEGELGAVGRPRRVEVSGIAGQHAPVEAVGLDDLDATVGPLREGDPADRVGRRRWTGPRPVHDDVPADQRVERVRAVGLINRRGPGTVLECCEGGVHEGFSEGQEGWQFELRWAVYYH